eukprot:CAMPEP_0184193420 /NCGR_PEP_ID=MMETSP0976-20121227/3973_1 /TAXON_ID=483370 /ORGANISM="non described non described, Strain CCMP2097" /LENGTH=320 /DNA_ID=CAMNT_0026497829 /DNA_START=141 /DNA_END=1102 /DNA_ORIENTATION=-
MSCAQAALCRRGRIREVASSDAREAGLGEASGGQMVKRPARRAERDRRPRRGPAPSTVGRRAGGRSPLDELGLGGPGAGGRSFSALRTSPGHASSAGRPEAEVRAAREREGRAAQRALGAALGERIVGHAAAREAATAGDVAAGRLDGVLFDVAEADGALVRVELCGVGLCDARRLRRLRVVLKRVVHPAQLRHRRRPAEVAVAAVVAPADAPAVAAQGRAPPVQVLARGALVADPPARAVAQDAQPLALRVAPPRSTVLLAAPHVDAIRARVAGAAHAERPVHAAFAVAGIERRREEPLRGRRAAHAQHRALGADTREP